MGLVSASVLTPTCGEISGVGMRSSGADWIFRSHVEPLHLAQGVISPEDMGGNEFADAFAEKGAAMNQLSEDQVQNARALDRNVGVWQKWLLAVTHRCCDVDPPQPKKFQAGSVVGQNVQPLFPALVERQDAAPQDDEQPRQPRRRDSVACKVDFIN